MASLQDKTILMVSHDLAAIRQTAHRMIYLEETIRFDGPTEEFPDLTTLAGLRGIEPVHGHTHEHTTPVNVDAPNDGEEEGEKDYRFQWNSPILISKFNSILVLFLDKSSTYELINDISLEPTEILFFVQLAFSNVSLC